jgi:allantoinase
MAIRPYDLVIRGGTLVTPTELLRADLAVAGGRIAAIEPEVRGASREALDATGLYVMPALIDAHVHFNEPGRTHWEGIASGSRAIAAGGGATFFDMPLNAHPPTVDAAAFDAKLAAAQATSVVDFALWGGLVPGNLGHMEALAARGVIGLKAFMSSSGVDDFAAADDLTLYEGMARAAALGLPVAVHAENDTITTLLARRAVAQGRTTARDYLASRPVIAELEAIARAILFARDTGCALHIVHVSTGRGVELVAEARRQGVDVSCETCPHYLVLDEDDLERAYSNSPLLGALAKCAPPLRPRAEQEALWEHLRTGALPMIASDHSPAPADLKQGADFFRIWGGISGCQSTLPLLLDAGHLHRGLPLTTIARATATYPAERFGLAPRKGQLAVGADADLALIDLHAADTITADRLFYRHPHSPYLGRTVRGRVMRTLVRGTTVFLDGRIVAPPAGRLVTPL